MPKRVRLTRRLPIAMTEDGYRRLTRVSADAGLDEGEALFFLFKHFDLVINAKTPGHRLRLFNLDLKARKAAASPRGQGRIWVFMPKRNPRCAPTRTCGPRVRWAGCGPGRLLLGRSSAPQPVPH